LKPTFLSRIGTAGGGVKVGRFVCDPAQEATDVRACFQGIEIRECRGKILIGHAGVDDAVADRMNGYDLGTAAAFRNPVVPFHPSTQGSLA